MNAYLGLGIPAEIVSIRRVWHDKKKLRPFFEGSSNLNLRGLYWLSRDVLDDDDDDRKQALEPDAQGLRELRHVLEHRCLVLQELTTPEKMGVVATMTLRDFEAKARRLLKLVRAALIHLALAVHREEQIKAGKRRGPVGNVSLPTYIPTRSADD